MLELIQGLQQTQGELAKAIKQLKEKDAGMKTLPQNEGENQEKLYQDSGSHNKGTIFVTMSDVADLLKQEREKNPKEPRHFVRKPPYPMELLNRPYLEKYIVPTFSRFDGRKGSALVHISKFIDSMGAYASNGDLCLLEEKITLVNLHTTKQASGEDLLHYIHRFRDISLDCYANYEEGELVGVCIDNMLPEFRAHLENLDISRFAQLLQKARKTALSIKPHTEKPKEKKSQPQVLTMSIVNNKRKKSSERSFEEPPPPVPCILEDMIAVLNRWVADGVIKLPEAPKKATEEDKKNQKFCHFHQYIHHSIADCWTLRRKFHEKIQDGTLELPQAQQKVHTDHFLKHKDKGVVSVVIHGNASNVDMDEPATASTAMTSTAIKTLQRNPKFWSLFNQLGLNPGTRTAATEAIMAITAESGAHCFTAETHANRAFLETTNAITFTAATEAIMAIAAESDAHCFTAETHASRAFLETTNAIMFTDEKMEVQYPDHRHPFYLSTTINAVQVRRALVDTSSWKKLAPARINHSVCASAYWMIALFTAYEDAPTGESATTDPKISAKEELEVIDLSSDPNVHRPVSISASLSTEEIMHLVELLEECQDVFAWQYDEMPRIDPKLFVHSLNVEPGTRSVVQPMRTFHPEVGAQITQEIKKLLVAGFIKPIQHPRWLSNIVPDAEKTTFCMPIGNFYYTVMPFDLKNAGATYQRTMTAMFHDMMHLHQRDIDVDPARASAIATMKPPTTHKELKSFLGKLSYIRRFIPGLAAITYAFSPLLKKGVPFHWSIECLQAFEKVRDIMTKLPTVYAPIFGKPLRLYLASNSQAIGALIAQEDDSGVEQPIYYVSRALKDAKSRYLGAEQSCLALIYASQRLRHYFLAHQLSQYEIVTKTPTGIKSQAIANLLAQFPGEDSSTISDEVPGEINKVFLTSLADSIWTLRFDGSSTTTSAGAAIVLHKDDGEAVRKSFKFDFSCSNNAAEYEAYLAGLAIAYEMGIKHLRVIGDSNLMGNQGLLISGDLYRRLPGGVLAQCISMEEAKEKLLEVHEKTCGDGGTVSLYRRLQQLGYFWPSMNTEAANLQNQCLTYQFHHSNEEVCTTFISADWRTLFLKYLLEGILPPSPKDVYRLKRLILRYFVERGTLFRKGFHGEPLRCFSLPESQMVMRETHAGECGEHQGKKRLYQCLLTLGYYWPTMKKDAADFVKTCHTCQVQANLIHTHPTSLQNMTTPWPFHKAIPLQKATGAAVANFIQEHIITRFGIPYKLISDNGTPFINKDVREVLQHYQVKHRHSTPYYPQGNGQAKATNRMLLRILNKIVFDYGNDWKAHLADVLWAYRSSPKTATGFTPFSLVYGIDTISPTELVVPSPRVMQEKRGVGSPHYPAVTVDTAAKPSTAAPDVTRKHEKKKTKRRTKGAHFQDGKSRSPGFMITGERAGFLHYPSIMVNAFRKASAAAPAETKSDGEDETRAERAKNAAMAAKAHVTQGQRPP
uniref:Integrase catalytic domain-containing protein n=1 Tax=Fagus sylvatica TaxID=28930 RepID=A0A2N9F490_FAGSY